MKKKLMTLEQRRLLRDAQQLLAFSENRKAKKKKMPEAAPSGDNTNTTVRLTRQVLDFLTKRYDFRYNLLTEETEFRPAGQRGAHTCQPGAGASEVHLLQVADADGAAAILRG